MLKKHHFDISRELLLERYKQGVRFLRPDFGDERTQKQCIANIYELPATVYFYDRESNLVDMNDHCAELLGAESRYDAIGKTEKDFLGKEFAGRISQNNSLVLRSQSLQVIEEDGERHDDLPLQGISFKFPWYHQDLLIGVFGCSIIIQEHSFAQLGMAVSKLISTGLLSSNPEFGASILQGSTFEGKYLSAREKEVLHHLAYGRKIQTIANELKVSKRTIETYLDRIKIKLDLSHREDIIAFYWDNQVRLR